MQQEALGAVATEALDALRIVGRAERAADQRLGGPPGCPPSQRGRSAPEGVILSAALKPVGMALSTLAHRVEAERGLAFGRELRIEPVAQGFFWEAFGVLADLGDACLLYTSPSPRD